MKEKILSNQRNCALRALEGSLLLIFLSSGHETQKADVIELCDKAWKNSRIGSKNEGSLEASK